MTLKIETIDAIAGAGGKVTLYGGLGTAILTFAINNFVGLMGLLVALLGFWVNLHYKRKADKRYAEEAKQREIRHAARAEMQLAVARQAMELREEARKQKREEWAARMEFMRVTGRVPADPPPTDWQNLEELTFPSDEDQDRADANEADADGH